MTMTKGSAPAVRGADIEALENRLRAALRVRGLKLKRARFSYSICDETGEKLAEGFSLDNVGNFARQRGYRARGQRARMAEARAALATKGYKLRQGRTGLAVIGPSGQPIGYPMSLSQVEMFVFATLSPRDEGDGSRASLDTLSNRSSYPSKMLARTLR